MRDGDKVSHERQGKNFINVFFFLSHPLVVTLKEASFAYKVTILLSFLDQLFRPCKKAWLANVQLGNMVVKEYLENKGVVPVARRRIVRMDGGDITIPLPTLLFLFFAGT